MITNFQIGMHLNSVMCVIGLSLLDRSLKVNCGRILHSKSISFYLRIDAMAVPYIKKTTTQTLKRDRSVRIWPLRITVLNTATLKEEGYDYILV